MRGLLCVVFWSTSPHLGTCIRLKASSSRLWRHHSFSVERSKCFCKLSPEKMRMSHVAKIMVLRLGRLRT